MSALVKRRENENVHYKTILLLLIVELYFRNVFNKWGLISLRFLWNFQITVKWIWITLKFMSVQIHTMEN